MAMKTINVGVKPNDGTGDPNRDAFIKANENFQELFTKAADTKVTTDEISSSLDTTNSAVSTLAAALQGAAAGNRTAELWTALSAKAPDREYQPATVPDTDTGTHVDPVTGATVPNAGEYRGAQQGWRWVSANASAVKRLAGGTVLSSLSTHRFAVIAADGATSGLISFTDLLTQILGEIMPKRYSFDNSQVVGTSPVRLVPADPTIKSIEIQHPSETARLAVAFGGKMPAVNGLGSYSFDGGVIFSDKDLSENTGEIWVVSSEANTPVSCRFANTSGIDPNSEARAIAHIARYTGTLNSSQSTAIKKLFKTLDSAGLLKADRKPFFMPFIAPNSADGLMDWAGGAAATLVNAPSFSAFDGFTFDGATNYLDTNRVLAAIGTNADHTLMVDVGTTATQATTNACALGDASSRIQPNRSTTAARYNSASATGDIATGFPPGGLFGLTRRSVDEYEAWRNADITLTIARTAGSLSSTVHLLAGCANGSSGPTTFFNGKLRMVAGMTKMTRAEEIAFAQAWATFKTEMGIV
ncbi:hypothetical protein IFT84_13720 [Rhizobium sp. CFBP 8762]|uniref:hypothetical protein n=1 Tax=Rhizobium sp. CFBP 8762 TaxID=2775279 RepID=UPI001782436D|nr:hypothetical protein [Rhizobium sp. CFBP 8762]MBD8555566.1 hypothetical protein [Rhizobium sp. CFBP 8762]